jgi:hypothetical protein
MLARQAAYGTLASAWNLYTGSRPAECFRLRWGDTGVPGAGKFPVWALVLAGMLQDFHDGLLHDQQPLQGELRVTVWALGLNS